MISNRGLPLLSGALNALNEGLNEGIDSIKAEYSRRKGYWKIRDRVAEKLGKERRRKGKERRRGLG